MKSWKREPDSPLIKQYVDCYWFLEKEEVSAQGNYPKLNPDPSAQLIIAPQHQTYQYQTNGQKAAGQGSHWIMPYSLMHQMDHTQRFIILGIKFHVGALYALDLGGLEVELNKIVACDLDSLIGNELDSVIGSDLLEGAQKSAKDNSTACCQQLDQLLEPWLIKAHKDKHSELVDKVLQQLSKTAISDMGAVLHCSQRTVERSFLRVTGFTLKQCQSLNNFERLLEHVTHLCIDEIDWAVIAHEYGFSDQPHLIRYIKIMIGATPGEYSKQRDLTIDIYGDFKQDT